MSEMPSRRMWGKRPGQPPPKPVCTFFLFGDFLENVRISKCPIWMKQTLSLRIGVGRINKKYDDRQNLPLRI